MKNHCTLLVLAAVLFLLPTAVPAMELKTALENAQLNVRRAIASADLEAFRSSQCRMSGIEEMTGEEFKELVAQEAFQDFMLGWFFLDLKSDTRFLAVKSNGAWAAYYTETLLDDPEYAAISAFLFRKDDTRWRACGSVFEYSMALPGSAPAQRGLAAWEGREEMLKTIETHEDFTLEHLISLTSE